MPTPRIISGTARGKRLKDVPGDITRPITDRVKEALFNIISGDIVDASLLDLFAGTGSVGIEALSRGAAFVRFVDINRLAIETVQTNLAGTGLQENAEVLKTDAFSLLKRPADQQFDYVYIAPPQYKGMWNQALSELDQNPTWLSDESWIIVQIHPREYNEYSYTHFDKFDERKYGSTLLLFYETGKGKTT